MRLAPSLCRVVDKILVVCFAAELIKLMLLYYLRITICVLATRQALTVLQQVQID